jgi:hypothetical protein
MPTRIILLINLLVKQETAAPFVLECGLVVIVYAFLYFALQIELTLLKLADVEFTYFLALCFSVLYNDLLPLNPALVAREVNNAEGHKQ